MNFLSKQDFYSIWAHLYTQLFVASCDQLRPMVYTFVGPKLKGRGGQRKNADKDCVDIDWNLS